MKTKYKSGVVFLLPFGFDKPSGGVRLIYDYANKFAESGIEVLIIQASYFGKYQKGLKRFFRSLIKYIYSITLRKSKGCSWYHFNPLVKERFCWRYSNKCFPDAMAIIATTALTAPFLNSLDVEKKKKYYFIQGYETWNLEEKMLLETYRYDMNKIVVSKWLKTMLIKMGEYSELILNGFDFNEFHLIIPIANKNECCVSMLYHKSPLKDVQTGFKALDIVKREIPDLHVYLFGTPECPKALPSWYTYYRTPDNLTHNQINNEAAIYLGTSKSEGWGLTIGEAMICGQAVVCTNNAGFLEMARNKETALVSNIGDYNGLANNIIELIKNKEKRVSMATVGNTFIKSFNREKSSEKFVNYIINNSR